MSSRLERACVEGNIDQVISYIEDTDYNPLRVVVKTICSDKVEVLKLLLKKNNFEASFGEYLPLLLSVQKQNLTVVTLLLEDGRGELNGGFGCVIAEALIGGNFKIAERILKDKRVRISDFTDTICRLIFSKYLQENSRDILEFVLYRYKPSHIHFKLTEEAMIEDYICTQDQVIRFQGAVLFYSIYFDRLPVEIKRVIFRYLLWTPLEFRNKYGELKFTIKRN